MPHQETLTVIAEVVPGQLAPLQQLLGRIRDHVDDWNVIPFAQLRRLHFARFIALEAANDVDGRPVPAQLYLLTNVDAPLRNHLDELSTVGGEGIDKVFSHCVGYPVAGERSPAARLAFLRDHQAKSAAVHINRRGRSVEQIHQEEGLRKQIEQHLDSADFSSLSPVQVKHQIVAFVRGRPELDWALRLPEPPALSWRIKEALHAVFGLLAVLVLSPLLLLGLPLFLLLLRRHEKRDLPNTSAASPQSVQAFRDDEDFWAQNQIVAVGFLKPGVFRDLTTTAILTLTDYATRHIYNRGILSGLNTIHIASWVRTNGRRGMLFSSNYDGSLESYMNDFIDKAAWGLNAIFSNGDGFPRTCFMFCGGITDEKAYKRLLPTKQAPSNVWYSAYPHLTTKNIANNESIRRGLSEEMDEAQTRRWLRRFGCGNELPQSNWVARSLDSVRWDLKCRCK